jgi:hypothetical protein
MTLITKPARKFIAKIREINLRYEGKRVEMSTGVKITLLMLRVYLLLLVGLMVYSFITKL